MIEYSGGRAGVHEYGWARAGYKRDEIESLRQQLLSQNDVGKIQQALHKLGIRTKRATIELVKRYNFDSQGLGFVYDNYAAWRRLATGKGTIGDATYIIHEITEVEALQRIQQKTGFNFIGTKNVEKLSRAKRQQWKNDFRQNYLPCHSKALEAEYKFLAEQINEVTNGKANISFLQAAAIDPTRRILDQTGDTEAWRHLLVDGIPLKEHHNFGTWRQRANEFISLSPNLQKRLGYYLPKIRLAKLIRLTKSIPLN